MTLPRLALLCRARGGSVVSRKARGRPDEVSFAYFADWSGRRLARLFRHGTAPYLRQPVRLHLGDAYRRVKRLAV